MKMRGALLAGAVLLLCSASGAAHAASAPEKLEAREGVEALLDLMIDKKVITEEEAVDFLGELETGKKGAQPGRFQVVVPGKEEQKVASLPEWLERIRISGDIRLRYQGDFFDEGNPEQADPNNLLQGQPEVPMNTAKDRSRLRYRARLSVNAQVNDQLTAGVRMTSGNERDPVSTNETLGDFLNKDGLVIDRAYLQWKPRQGMTVWGGRFANPWFSSDLVWDNDLNFEGVAAGVNLPVAPSLDTFFTAGAFPLQEIDISSKDKWLYGVQAGVRYAPTNRLNLKAGVAYYHFENMRGELNEIGREGEKDFTAPLFTQKGNSYIDIDPDQTGRLPALASDFRELDFLATADLRVWDTIHLILMGEYVTNLGFDRDEIIRRYSLPGLPENKNGYQVGIAVGHPEVGKRLGDWQVSLGYRYLGGDAVVDAFTDSDFHLGGTNSKGWILGGEVGLGKKTSLKGRWMSSDEIEGLPLAIDVLQIDLSAAF